MAYERLTGKSECGYNNLDACLNCDLEMDCGLCPYWAEALDRLAELEDKIEQGTLIEFPRIVKTKRLDVKYYVECKNKFYGGIIDCYECDTREKAENKLKELQNG